MSSIEWDSAEFRVKSDTPWCAQYRWLQSWYRETVLKVEAGRDAYKPRGNLIAKSALEQQPDLNFLSREIWEYAAARADEVIQSGGTLEKNRLFQNMLSSMPLCFNLFGELRQKPEETAALFRTLLGLDIAKVISIEVEYAPSPHFHLKDRTAFDAFVSYLDSKGNKGFIGIETKYTEAFSREEYLNERYAEITTDKRSGFKKHSLNALKTQATNQLWRNAILALSLKWTEGYEHATVLVISCAEDKTAKKAVEGVRAQRTEGDGLIQQLSLEKIMEHAQGVPALAEWSRKFTTRYLDLRPVIHAQVLNRK
jgi:hypothetical protein